MYPALANPTASALCPPLPGGACHGRRERRSLPTSEIQMEQHLWSGMGISGK